MISLSRDASREAFTADEIELVALLGRLVATAVQNIRAYEAERQTVEELRRLSALRADFVSLVSHELRSPMAAVIGAARTLQERWRQLTPDQRDAFLALIARRDEPARRADRRRARHVAHRGGDVLATASPTSTSAALVQDAVVVGGASGRTRCACSADVAEPLPPMRGDRERLRQVIANLIDNAVKYSPSGRRGRRDGGRARTAPSASTCATAARASRSTSSGSSSRSSAARTATAARSRAPGSASSSRARSRRRTAASLEVESQPDEGADVHARPAG